MVNLKERKNACVPEQIFVTACSAAKNYIITWPDYDQSTLGKKAKR